MRRRGFIAALGGAAAWPLVARAQQTAMPVIGCLNSQSPDGYAPFVAAFLKGLGQAGFVEGHNVAIEYRWANGQYDQMPALAADLVRRQINVIFASGGDASALAAKTATSSIPTVFIIGGDPVSERLVASLGRPSGNLTGLTLSSASLEAKRLELLHQMVPRIGTIAVLMNPTSPRAEGVKSELQAAAKRLGLRVSIFNARDAREVETAFEDAVRQGAGGFDVTADPFFVAERDGSSR